MLGLKWVGCDKIFSSIPWCVTEIWVTQGQKGVKMSSSSYKDFSAQPWRIFYFIFLLERASQDAGHHRALFLKFLYFSWRKRLTRSTTQKRCQKWVSSHINVCIYNKKKAQLKKGLCGALHLDTLVQTKKNLNILIEPGPRNPCLKINKIINREKTKNFLDFSWKMHIFQRKSLKVLVKNEVLN